MSDKNLAIKFGTDGWRAVIGREYTFGNVAILSQAVSDYFKKKKKGKLTAVVGFDTRFLSKEFALEAASVFVANKINVIFSDMAIPTPAISFAVKYSKADFGIVITASHNPPEFNGFKIKDDSGGAADVDITSAVEKNLFKSKVKKIDLSDKKFKENFKVTNLTDCYRKFLQNYIDLNKIQNSGLKILVDVMHGSGNGFIRDCIGGGSIQIHLMREDINPVFDGARPEPLPENLSVMISRMKAEKFDLGLVLDGDADRIAAVDSNGEFISPQTILCLLILHLVQDRREKGAIVKTIVGSSLIDKICQRLKLKLYETPVGFKYISKLMKEEDILIGGEEAGGIGFKNYIPERDGSLAGLLLLEMLAFRNSNINQQLVSLEAEYGKFYYTKDSIRLEHIGDFDLEKIKLPKDILGKKVVKIDKKDGIKFICSDGSWLMLRGSGTEPIVRVYAESATKDEAGKMISFGKKMIGH
ncbi:MAG: phosphoglucomutase/phosphomannomutase family protein [Candidatus Omnitrophota bacterium]